MTDNNNRSSALRNLSRRVLLIIASTRRRFQDPNIAYDTGLTHQFCDKGDLCCAFPENELGSQYVDNVNMERRILAAIPELDLSYADDIRNN